MEAERNIAVPRGDVQLRDYLKNPKSAQHTEMMKKLKNVNIERKGPETGKQWTLREREREKAHMFPEKTGEYEIHAVDSGVMDVCLDFY